MKSFTIYQIVCTITDKTLISGSNLPHDHLSKPGRPAYWYDRGSWSAPNGTSGMFWKSPDTVRKHLQNLCHDWDREFGEYYPKNIYDSWLAPLPGSLDWSRLNDLTVESYLITNYYVTRHSAKAFMGIEEQVA